MGRWLRVNQKLCEITGYSEEELLRLTFQDVTHPDDLVEDLELIRKMLAEEIILLKNGIYINLISYLPQLSVDGWLLSQNIVKLKSVHL